MKIKGGSRAAEKVIVLIRTAQVKQRLMRVYTAKEAEHWIHSPQRLLEGSRPIDLLSTDAGYMEVDTVIDRLLSDTYL